MIAASPPGDTRSKMGCLRTAILAYVDVERHARRENRRTSSHNRAMEGAAGIEIIEDEDEEEEKEKDDVNDDDNVVSLAPIVNASKHVASVDDASAKPVQKCLLLAGVESKVVRIVKKKLERSRIRVRSRY